MNIVIAGSGNVGRALAGGWRKAGHTISFVTRAADGAKAAELKREGFGVVPLASAADGAEAIVLAVLWSGAEAIVEALRPLAGKILIDATNPLTAKLELALGFDYSAGEVVARIVPRARVVKAFNTTGASNMADSAYPGGKLMAPVAGDDADAKKTVMALASDLGFEPVDFGPLTMSRYLEPMAMAWIKLAYTQGMGMNFGFGVLKR
jgi:hypothetical protein